MTSTKALTSKPGTIQEAEVSIDDIVLPTIFKMREKDQDHIEQLATSMSIHGQINPLTVRRKNSKYELVSGWQRYWAIKHNKWGTVRVYIRELTDEAAFVLALSENMHRKDPSPLDEARAFKKATTDLGMNSKDVAKMINRSPAFVSNRMRLLGLEKTVVTALKNGEITPGHCEHGFMQLKNHADQKKMLTSFRAEVERGDTPTVHELREAVIELNTDAEKRVRFRKFMKDHKDKMITLKCPTCKKDPDPLKSKISETEPVFDCGTYHYLSHQVDNWNPFIKYGKMKKGGTKATSRRRSKYKHDNTRGSMCKKMKSHLSIMEWFEFLFTNVMKAKLKIVQLTTGPERGFRGGDYCLRCDGAVDKTREDLLKYEFALNSRDEADKKIWKTDIYLRANSRKDMDEARSLFELLEEKARAFFKVKKTHGPPLVAREAHYNGHMWRDDIKYTKGMVLPVGAFKTKNPVEIKDIYEDLTMLVIDTKTKKDLFFTDHQVKAMSLRMLKIGAESKKTTKKPKKKEAAPSTKKGGKKKAKKK